MQHVMFQWSTEQLSPLTTRPALYSLTNICTELLELALDSSLKHTESTETLQMILTRSRLL